MAFGKKKGNNATFGMQERFDMLREESERNKRDAQNQVPVPMYSEPVDSAKEIKYVDEFSGETTQQDEENAEKLQQQEVIARVRANMRDRFGERLIKERNTQEFRYELQQAISIALQGEGHIIRSVMLRDQLANQIFHLIAGYGPLDSLFDQGYSEIMVSRYDKIFVEKDGKMVLSGYEFSSEEELLSIIDMILAPLGRVINQASPYVDGRLPDGSRFNAVIKPIAVDGAQLTIRRFPEKKITSEDYLKFGSLNKDVLQFLQYAVEGKFNTIVSGGTGSGKTTLLNLLSNFLCYDPGLAVVTIEDSCELRINHPNVRRYETRNANADGEGAVTARDMVKNAMRVRPDVIVIGEIRDGTMADFLRLATSGHDGCLTTVHNNSPQELEQTIQVLFQMAKDYDFTESAISRLYCAGVDLIVQIKRCSDYVRRITHVSHVVGYGKLGASRLGIKPGDPDYDPAECYIRDIFVWEPWGVDEHGIFYGDYVPTGYVPEELIQKARDHKVFIDRNMFVRKQPMHEFKGGEEG